MKIGIEIDDLIEENHTLGARRKESWKIFLAGDVSGQPADEVMEEWSSAGKAAEGLAHTPSGDVDEQERYKRCLGNWEVMESRLHTRLSSQQEAFKGIDDDLDSANR